MITCKSKYRFAVILLFLLCAVADLSEPCIFNSLIVPGASLGLASPQIHKASLTLPSDDDYFYCAKQPVLIEVEAIPIPSLVTIGQVYQEASTHPSLQKKVFRRARAPTTVSTV